MSNADDTFELFAYECKPHPLAPRFAYIILIARSDVERLQLSKKRIEDDWNRKLDPVTAKTRTWIIIHIYKKYEGTLPERHARLLLRREDGDVYMLVRVLKPEEEEHSPIVMSEKLLLVDAKEAAAADEFELFAFSSEPNLLHPEQQHNILVARRDFERLKLVPTKKNAYMNRRLAPDVARNATWVYLDTGDASPAERQQLDHGHDIKIRVRRVKLARPQQPPGETYVFAGLAVDETTTTEDEEDDNARELVGADLLQRLEQAVAAPPSLMALTTKLGRLLAELQGVHHALVMAQLHPSLSGEEGEGK